ncbi:hypothetical protein D1224_01710 [Henriciella barbarensis]|uniref:Cytochrome c domain-containing protein n=1 Tax=Henriciella barbarensis TaxID=86342 RepID=A0A399R5K2_9PROT|nr:cytochrome c [Henriciella barbarensis]RIJ25861.1 hypothetical protein D1224_01710 [Henriciella barbarensis]
MDKAASADQDGNLSQVWRDEGMKTSWRVMGVLAAGLLPLAACGTSEEMGTPAAEPVEEAPNLAVSEPVSQAEAMQANELVGQGEAIAETLCAGCHAIGLTGESQHAQAMPFREISWHYPVEVLAEPFGEGIMVGHPEMPQWQFEPEQIDALLAYLETVQVPEEG